MKKLSDISNIITGHVFRSKVEYTINGNVNLVNMEAISSIGEIKISDIDTRKVIAKDLKSTEILSVGDILFKAKGLANNAIVIEAIPDNTTVTASCLIVRVTGTGILPEYVCCWLNSDFAKNHFSKSSGQATGVTIANVSKAVLGDLEIKIPPLEQQQRIVEIANLAKLEIEILKDITNKKEQLNTIVLAKELQKI